VQEQEQEQEELYVQIKAGVGSKYGKRMQALVVAAGPEVPPTSSPDVLTAAWQYLSATAIVLSSDDGLPPGDPDPCVFLVEIAVVSEFL
jgi:hypothetical protein